MQKLDYYLTFHVEKALIITNIFIHKYMLIVPEETNIFILCLQIVYISYKK